jgi:hypothetical protein
MSGPRAELLRRGNSDIRLQRAGEFYCADPAGAQVTCCVVLRPFKISDRERRSGVCWHAGSQTGPGLPIGRLHN